MVVNLRRYCPTLESVAATGSMVTIKLKKLCAVSFSMAFSGMPSPKAYEMALENSNRMSLWGLALTKLTSFSPNLVKMDVSTSIGVKTNPGIDFQILSSTANLYNSFTTVQWTLLIKAGRGSSSVCNRKHPQTAGK